jgi:hypothetical protein
VEVVGEAGVEATAGGADKDTDTDMDTDTVAKIFARASRAALHHPAAGAAVTRADAAGEMFP